MDDNSITGQITASVAAIAAGVVAAVAILVRGWGAVRRSSQTDSTEVETLRMLQAAVVHWTRLYDTAWDQVKKERQLREAAEAKAATAMAEVEELRGEVAELQRKIEHLTSIVRQHHGLDHPT